MQSQQQIEETKIVIITLFIFNLHIYSSSANIEEKLAKVNSIAEKPTE